jgi:hypothetical protein
MVPYMKRLALMALLALLLAGCGKESVPPTVPAAAKEKYLLTAEPTGAKGVLDIRKDAKNGDEVVMVGRVGGSVKPQVPGRASFTIVDPFKFKPCNEKEGDTCETPWDYCCDSKEELKLGTATVKVVDDQGLTIVQDSKEWLGIEPLQTVVVRGKLQRDTADNLVVLASSVYVRPAVKKDKP